MYTEGHYHLAAIQGQLDPSLRKGIKPFYRITARGHTVHFVWFENLNCLDWVKEQLLAKGYRSDLGRAYQAPHWVVECFSLNDHHYVLIQTAHLPEMDHLDWLNRAKALGPFVETIRERVERHVQNARLLDKTTDHVKMVYLAGNHFAELDIVVLASEVVEVER